MRSLLRVLTVTATMLVLFVHAASVQASPSSSLAKYKPTSPAALAHFEAGNRLYKSGVDAERPFVDRVRDLKRAIEEYRAGVALEPAPAFHLNIGLTAWALADNSTAVAHLLRFLDAQPDAQLRVKVEKEIDVLDPSGAIREDLRRAGARSGDPKPGTRAGEPNESPKPVVPQAAAPLAPASVAPGPSPSPREQPTTSVLARSEPHSRGWASLGWSLAASGVVGGGVTAWLAVSASDLDADSKETSRPSADRLDLEQRSRSRRRAATIVGIGSGVALVLGIVTLALPARSSGSKATAWNVGLTGDGVAVVGVF